MHGDAQHNLTGAVTLGGTGMHSTGLQVQRHCEAQHALVGAVALGGTVTYSTSL